MLLVRKEVAEMVVALMLVVAGVQLDLLVRAVQGEI